MSGEYPYQEGPRARAITWDEFKRGGGGGGGGGGPGGSDDEPSWLGKKFREWACKLIDHERDTLESQTAQTPADYIAARKRQKDLTTEFNRLSDEPGINVTVDAIRTILRYKLPFAAPA